jgi:hypothetical protein
MTVKELIEELSKFDQNLEVTITDGHRCHAYKTDKIELKTFEARNWPKSVDIGIGGNDWIE